MFGMFGANTCKDCPYTILSVSSNASDAEIRKGYRTEQIAGAKRMQQINGAYEMLCDPVLRAQHNRQSHPQQMSTQPRPASAHGQRPQQTSRQDPSRPSTAPNPEPPRQTPRPQAHPTNPSKWMRTPPKNPWAEWPGSGQAPLFRPAPPGAFPADFPYEQPKPKSSTSQPKPAPPPREQPRAQPQPREQPQPQQSTPHQPSPRPSFFHRHTHQPEPPKPEPKPRKSTPPPPPPPPQPKKQNRTTHWVNEARQAEADYQSLQARIAAINRRRANMSRHQEEQQR